MRRPRPKIKDEDRNVSDPAKARQKTFDRAVNLLTFRARTVAELRERLLEKAWTNEEIVAEVIDKLAGYNYLDDEKFAASFARSKLRQKPVGRFRLRQDLKRKKLDEKVIETALDRAYEDLPEDDLIEEALEKRLRTKGPPRTWADKKKISDHLVRLGFGYDLIREKMDGIRIEESEF